MFIRSTVVYNINSTRLPNKDNGFSASINSSCFTLFQAYVMRIFNDKNDEFYAVHSVRIVHTLISKHIMFLPYIIFTLFVVFRFF